MSNKRIETSPEIEAILLSFARRLQADAAILYKCVDTNDLEGTEILELLSKSPVVEPKTKEYFYKSIINVEIFKEFGSLQTIIDEYDGGTLELGTAKTNEILKRLKEHIRILRFCYIAEQDTNSKHWDFSYKQRPPKYLIFSPRLLQQEYHDKEIPSEGVTAFFFRALSMRMKREGKTVPCVCKTRGEISVMDSHRKIKEEQDTSTSTVYNNYDSHSAAWILLNDSNGDAMGCLRLEYYHNDKRTPHNISSDIKPDPAIMERVSSLPVTQLFGDVITTVLTKQNDKSYENSYHCLDQFLLNIEQIGLLLKKNKNNPECEFDKLFAIHYLIEHLLYVLKRNTYYGDQVLERVSFFITDLLETLDLHVEVFGEVWNSLRRHEDLMLYNIEKYRDHFMHQFHVFISGYIIIHSYGIEWFTNLLNSCYSKHIRQDGNRGEISFSQLDVVRVWALSSLFHDSGYAFEKLGRGLEDFSKKVMGSKLKSYFYWDDAIFNSKNANIPTEIEKICKYYNPCAHISKDFDNVGLFKILIREGIVRNDHGVISSIILLQKHFEDEKEYKDVRLINHHIYIASLAIALHNSGVYSEIRDHGASRICLMNNPIAFLLAYCDHSQEWGRQSEQDRGKSVVPFLHAFNALPHGDGTFPDVMINLRYPSGEAGRTPESKKIRKILNTVKDTFTSPSGMRFRILYDIRNSSLDSFSIEFCHCPECRNCHDVSAT